MENTLNERFKKILFELNMNASEFANKLGYGSPEKISRLLRKNSAKPSFDILKDIANNFDNINVVWLLNGSGSMFKDFSINTDHGSNFVVGNSNNTNTNSNNNNNNNGNKVELEQSKKENEMLKELIKSKDEIIELLRSKKE